MATIDLNNLIQPKKVNSPTTYQDQQVETVKPVYVDLHLDLAIQDNIGSGFKSVKSKDIRVDTDTQAIKNSIKNIFTTKKGEKILDPDFGCSLEQFLFEKVSEVAAKAIGDTIYDALYQYEPRVDVLKIYVDTQPYTTKNLKIRGNSLTSIITNENLEIGPGYAVTVIYKFKDISKQDNLILFAQSGGQILF
jgi:phage baseplate assembly protein W